MKENYRVIGLMSGTSMDGLDMVACEFSVSGATWSYSIHGAETIPYSSDWVCRLQGSYEMESKELKTLDIDYGVYLGEAVKTFMDRRGFNPDLVCSHGHTILHQPDKRITFQAGSGMPMAKVIGKTVVADFRTLDVNLGGQGAPLVPVGDEYLFGEFDGCLNLGGFANISYKLNGNRHAYDICPVNFALNHCARKMNFSFDEDGRIAATGKLNPQLLTGLNELPFYKWVGPKSLGKEWFERKFLPVIEESGLSLEDLMRTLCEHISIQLTKSFSDMGKDQPSILVTGGGVHNKFLLNTLTEKTKAKLIIPDKVIVDYKEALIFGFLGVMRMRKEINCFSSVTGAERDSSTGEIFTVG